MPRTVTITARRLECLERAERFCQVWRAFQTMRACDRRESHNSISFGFFDKWFRVAGKRRFEIPDGWPNEAQK